MAKNKHYESKFKNQRIFGSKPNQRLENGIVVRHMYNEPRAYSWWDDTGFNLNGRRVMIWWTHPRCNFNDAISDLAYENIPYPYENESLLRDSEKIYKYVGKNGKRKKLDGFACKPIADRRKWYDALTAEENRLKKVTDLIITPQIKVDILNWCRGVHICAPLEINGVADLHILCNLVKRLLKGETSLEKEFPGYTYSKENWANEKHD
mgnify:CR=1 FL=1